MKGPRLSIDPDALDQECLDQAEMVFEWSVKAAAARAEHDAAKAEYDLLKAKADQTVRSNPTLFGLKESPTEPSIRAAIEKKVEIQESLVRISRARYRQQVNEAAVNALEHKKRALGLLVDLHKTGFYSELPTVGGSPVRKDKRQEFEVLSEEEKASVRGRGAKKR